MENKKYYVMPCNQVIDNGSPVDMTGVVVVELPATAAYCRIQGKDKMYPCYKVALAIARGQITVDKIANYYTIAESNNI